MLMYAIHTHVHARFTSVLKTFAHIDNVNNRSFQFLCNSVGNEKLGEYAEQKNYSLPMPFFSDNESNQIEEIQCLFLWHRRNVSIFFSKGLFISIFWIDFQF